MTAYSSISYVLMFSEYSVQQTFFACTFCFHNTDHVIILRRFDPLSCSLKIVHANIFRTAQDTKRAFKPNFPNFLP